MIDNKSKKGIKFVKNKDEDILRDIKEYFQDPKIFLQKSNKIFIGKSSLRYMDINYKDFTNSTNKKMEQNNNLKKSLKGININTDVDLNLSTIQNISKKLNSNTINISKELVNNDTNNSKIFKNTKNDNNNNNNNIIVDINKQSLFNQKTNENINNEKIKNIDENNNGKMNSYKFSKQLYKNKRLFLKSKEKRNKTNTKNTDIKSLKMKNNSGVTSSINSKRPMSVGIHYQFKTSQEIVKSYEIGKNREEESKMRGTNYFIPKEVEEKTKLDYLTQEKRLKQNSMQMSKDKNISNYLSKKCHKKEENLLYNNIEDFRIKKQLLEYIENKKDLSEKLGNHYWYVNLRRPDFIMRPRELYLNIGKAEHEIWEPVVEFPMKNVEIIKKAETPHKERNFEKFLKNNNLYPSILFNPNKKHVNVNKMKKKDINKMPNLTEMNDMVIKGKNMISFEKENFLNHDEQLNLTSHKYRVFKDPREENLKYSKDFLYKFNYKYEGSPKKVNLGIKANKRNKTPVVHKNKNKKLTIFSSDKNGNKLIQ